MRQRPLRLLVQAVALAGVVAGSVGFAGLDKSIDLVVDGRTHTVHAMGGTVADVLQDQHIRIGEHDVVAPAPTTKVHDGSDVVVRYGRKLTVTLDGRTRDYWTTALTVDQALADLGLRADAARLSVSRSQPLGRQGLSMSMTTAKRATVAVDGRTLTATTFAPTVGALLTELGVSVGKDDRISVPASTPLAPGLQITVTRIVQKLTTATRAVGFGITKKKTDTLAQGTTKVQTKGKPGQQSVTWADVYTNGKLTAHRLVRAVVTIKPVQQVVLVGTKASSAGDPGSVSGTSGLNWGALADCESGGNPKAVNPAGYYGLYQFDVSTWQSVGGSGKPTDASSSEQTHRAQILYSRVGRSAWPVCGKYL